MDLNLKDKTALVCGSSQGIGRSCATILASLGAQVILVARSQDKLKMLVSELPMPINQKHQYIACDLHQSGQLEKLIASVLKEQSIQILVNNAGGPSPGPLLEASTDDFQKAFQTHLHSSHILVQLLFPSMKKAQYGRIINILSTSVKTPLKGLGVSNTLRAAMANWSKTLANELGPYGITVNNILPGYILTDRLMEIVRRNALIHGRSEVELLKDMEKGVPLRRIGKDEEVANLCGFLASPAASYITGTNIAVDGGRTPSL